jgi:hypothetical protein
MQQFFWDAWGKLDWPNLIVGGLLAIILSYLSTKIYPVWEKSRETSHIILSKRKKSAIKRDMEIVLKMRKDPNYMTMWCAQKVIMIVSFLGVAIIIVVLFGMYVLIGIEKLDRSSLVGGGTFLNFLIVFFTMPLTLMFVELLNFGRVTSYYTKFDEFNKRAGEILTLEELAELEKADAP